MAWGSQPDFTVHGELSFARCAQLFVPHKSTGMFNISTQRPTRSNYHIREVLGHGEETRVIGYALKMYNTDIITWFRDSSVRYIAYDSAITHSTQTEFGPLRIWRHSRAGYRCQVRFGHWGSSHYPFCPSGYEMTIDPDGYIRGLWDERRRIIPDRKPGRREKLKKFREQALGRVMLGEFPELALLGQHTIGRKHRNEQGWAAMLPTNRMALFIMLKDGASFDEISGWLAQNKLWPACVCASKTDAFAKVVQCLGRSAMDIYEDFEWHRIDYDPVNVRDL